VNQKPKHKRAGRPPLPKGHAKAGTLRVRVTPADLQAFAAKARASKKTVSEWIRSTLNAAIEQ
jgi:predicted HicB family RNase H-like nuclease